MIQKLEFRCFGSSRFGEISDLGVLGQHGDINDDDDDDGEEQVSDFLSSKK